MIPISKPPPAPDEEPEDTESDKIRDKKLEQALNMLSEHFLTTQIIATYEKDGKYGMRHKGRGDYYARYGATRTWVLREEREP